LIGGLLAPAGGLIRPILLLGLLKPAVRLSTVFALFVRRKRFTLVCGLFKNMAFWDRLKQILQ
jgi:hypothetical protein